MNGHKPLDVTIIGAGMIVHDLILPSVFELQRSGHVGDIAVCDLRAASLKALKEDTVIREAFPDQDFTSYPPVDSTEPGDPGMYKKVLADKEPYQMVVVALPDQLHYRVVMDVLEFDQHVLCVKPLVMKHDQGVEIEKAARARNLLVGVEYHKRFDRRSLIARRRYRRGDLGEFVMGEAKMIEPYYYRSSNFQNWFKAEETDPFVYVGCHYVDLVGFITGLKPVEVSVSGVKGCFPNGVEAYMWAHGRVRYENGAVLSVIDGLGYPDEGAGSNDQCLSMFFEGPGKGGALRHNDQFRGVEHGYVRGSAPDEKLFHYVNPDFFQFVPYEGPGYKPIGYGVDSIAATITAAGRIESEVDRNPGRADEVRREMVAGIDARGLIATPANSFTNELVHEAARASIVNDGDIVFIEYEPTPRIRFKHGS